MPGRPGSTSSELESSLAYRLAADLVALTHLAFVLFVVLGGLLALRWRGVVWVHLPSAVWGALIEFSGWICPLTPLENWLRRQADGTGYGGGFVEHYLIPWLYPEGLSRSIQLGLGATVIVLNVAIYSWIFFRKNSVRSSRH